MNNHPDGPILPLRNLFKLLEDDPAPDSGSPCSRSCDAGDARGGEDDAAGEEEVEPIRGWGDDCGAGVFVEAQLAPAGPCRWDDM